jgi:group I intron endonuclease
MQIYKCTHIQSGKCYIGQTIQGMDRRKLEHFSHARNSPKSYHFHNALRKYGEDAFNWEVLECANDLDHLNTLEEFYIQKFDSINSGYNIREGGDNQTHSAESKLRMSEAQKTAHARRRANGTDGGWKRKDGGPMKGKICSEEHKQKVGAANKGNFKNKTWKLVNGSRVWMEKV